MTSFAEHVAPAAELFPGAASWPGRLGAAKTSYITRHVIDLVPAGDELLLAPATIPSAGDVILARVESIGAHDWIERPDGRKARLFAGDEIVVAYGARYATDAYEAVVPDDFGPCDLVAAGGMAGRVVGAYTGFAAPTRIVPIGQLAGRDGSGLTVRDGAPIVPSPVPPPVHPPVVAVVGTSMNAGKTTSAASLVRGMTRAGRRVAAAKVTGTGAGNDRWHLIDAGGAPVLDFTDAGYPSTHLVSSDDLVATYFGLLSAVSAAEPDMVVIEIADGVAHIETARLLAEPAVRATLSGVLFAAGDALGALSGVNLLRSWHLRVTAVTGMVTASPLAAREAAGLVDVPVVATKDLMEPTIAAALVTQDSEAA
ncbi:DUF1611 domain-containing protein [Jiangella ureilytica]|uniref:DUF1611 domain-containing protein n=1 Tax=Jiangella ureilytica TaxID=2530374 RepID=A0A4V2XW91_9ACTN|nr:DUF1611 domain-containing protein [Jiangella ureilytica]TDC48365.1 DUF1611 domain-containing protein [Jiangella ureilytica]